MRRAEQLPPATRRPARGISARGRRPSGAQTEPGGTVRQMMARSSPGTWLRSDRLGEPVDRQDDLGCPPFLGPPQMGDYAENLHANRLTDFCTLIDPFLVTGRAELFRRRVLQRAMRPDGVVFPPVQCRLFPSVRHALEFHPLQELVTQSTVKRFYISILPGASRGYRDRLRPHTRQPVHQRLANELRSIVTPDAGRRPATTNHPGHDPPNIGPRYRAVR